MAAASQVEVTGLILAWGKVDQTALDKLLPLVYEELHRLAHRYVSRERGVYTLRTTALVHEGQVVDLRYFGGQSPSFSFCSSCCLPAAFQNLSNRDFCTT